MATRRPLRAPSSPPAQARSRTDIRSSRRRRRARVRRRRRKLPYLLCTAHADVQYGDADGDGGQRLEKLWRHDDLCGHRVHHRRRPALEQTYDPHGDAGEHGCGGDGVNYPICYVPRTQTFSTATLTVTAANASKNYGDTTTFAGTEFTTGAGPVTNSNTIRTTTLARTGAAAA